ncbi:pentapeptide repeat-containing protein [Kribbella sp. NPDC000426]|uniref:pentapeptide repeat-containing protein n=1 Tax=Kribbella sp. NPDC000426 TaxID=3154255 RepID=UPI0033281664
MGSLVLWASVAVVAAVAGAVALYMILAWLLDIDPHPEAATEAQQKLLADMVKIALGLAAGVGAAVALIVGYRRARVDESASFRDDRRLFSSRYQDAAELIGHDQASVRLAGIYAMARLADDWDEQRQQCIDVLCAYLRLPYAPDTDETGPYPSVKRRRARVTADGAGGRHGEREVRHTVIRLINEHLQHEEQEQLNAPPTWNGYRFDFTGAVFDSGDFSGAEFSRGTHVTFRDARFLGGTVDFSDAIFSGGVVDFTLAEFSDIPARRRQTVTFTGAKFSGGTVYFPSAEFSSGAVDFLGAEFSGGEVDFGGATFSGSLISLGTATFSGGSMYFSGTTLSGGIVDFFSATFNGGAVNFADAKFAGGSLKFDDATFAGGTVSFNDARFSGSEVDLSTAVLAPGGIAPQGLPGDSTEGLRLPTWM